ncbi:MAG: non-reducing end alpha-L-arabinofuranosidase family hydrolase, partial [Polyangiaceae bacterium]
MAHKITPQVLMTLLLATLCGGACQMRRGGGGAVLGESQPRARMGSDTPRCAISARLRWTSTGPLVGPVPDPGHAIVSVKDPTVVYFNDQWHLYATTADVAGHWSMEYVHFSDWSLAGWAQPYYMSDN